MLGYAEVVTYIIYKSFWWIIGSSFCWRFVEANWKVPKLPQHFIVDKHSIWILKPIFKGNFQVPPEKNCSHLKCQFPPKRPKFLLYKPSEKLLSPSHRQGGCVNCEIPHPFNDQSPLSMMKVSCQCLLSQKSRTLAVCNIHQKNSFYPES